MRLFGLWSLAKAESFVLWREKEVTGGTVCPSTADASTAVNSGNGRIADVVECSTKLVEVYHSRDMLFRITSK